MFSNSELKMLSEVGKGADTPSHLADAENRTKAQIYKVLGSLCSKGVLRLEKGKITIEDKTHAVLLLNVLRRLHGSYETLSNDGTEIISELAATPRSVNELAERIGADRSTVSRKIKKMESRSMVVKENGKYSLNRQVWPDLTEFAVSYSLYRKNSDPRAIRGSKIYYASDDLIIFSNDAETECTKTAFSRYAEFGISAGFRTNYYCDPERELSVSDVFMHSLHVISEAEDWWLKMMALIFYVKFKDELKDVSHKMKDEMDAVLSGSHVNGWVTMKEMQERADMYGVRL